MKLQINNSGAWRNAITFWVADVELLKQAAETLGELACSAGDSVKLRIRDGQEVVVLHWSLGEGWTVPRWAEGYTWVP